jgi:alanine racemase
MGIGDEGMGPTVAYINHRHLQHNIALIRQAVGRRKIMAVVKANAYGHGDLEVARTALRSGCEYLGVAFAGEGIRLRRAGITAPILVFGAQQKTCLKRAFEFKLEMTVTSLPQILYLKRLCEQKRTTASLHLKIDTGMNRVGFNYNDFEQALSTILTSRHLRLKGVYSHFATSDERDSAYARLQMKRFDAVRDYVRQQSPRDILFHMANSGAIMKFRHSYYDLVRPGIMLYGYLPSPGFSPRWKLKEVLSLQARLALIKYVHKNEPISYGRRYYTKADTYIGVIPAGYADGYNRNNTNRGEVLIGQKRYRLVGTVCMDMVMVNLGKKLMCTVGDKVVIYGRDGKYRISINDVARNLNTIPYEVTCAVSPRVPRIHVYKKAEELP